MTNDENMAIRPLVELEVVPGRDGVGRDLVGAGGVDSVASLQALADCATSQGYFLMAHFLGQCAPNPEWSDEEKADHAKWWWSQYPRVIAAACGMFAVSGAIRAALAKVKKEGAK